MASMFRQYMPIQEVPSDCSMLPPVGSGAERSKTPILSRPRKPPSKTFLPSVSLRLTHHVKLRRSFWNAFSRKSRSATPVTRRSILYTRHAAHACTGGVTSPHAHSQAGVWPLGGSYPPPREREKRDLP